MPLSAFPSNRGLRHEQDLIGLKIACLVWAPFSDRMDELAEAVGGHRKNFHLGYLPRYLAPMKYLYFFAVTQAYLFREKPAVVYAQNPPVFCPLACVPYCRITHSKLVVDHHNIWSVKVFGASRLAYPFRLLERLLGLFADINTVPHTVWKEGLQRLSFRRVMTVHDYVEANRFSRDQEARSRISSVGLIGIASGHQGYPLERVEAEALGAEAVDGLALVITGPPARLAPRIKALGELRNVKYLGYLPKDEYDRTKASCDFALNITDEPFTLNHVLFEYAAARLPTISTRREVIEAVFGDALVYVEESTASAVAEKLRFLCADRAVLNQYRERMSLKFSDLTESRRREIEYLKDLLNDK